MTPAELLKKSQDNMWKIDEAQAKAAAEALRLEHEKEKARIKRRATVMENVRESMERAAENAQTKVSSGRLDYEDVKYVKEQFEREGFYVAVSPYNPELFISWNGPISFPDLANNFSIDYS